MKYKDAKIAKPKITITQHNTCGDVFNIWVSDEYYDIEYYSTTVPIERLESTVSMLNTIYGRIMRGISDNRVTLTLVAFEKEREK